MMSNKKSVKKAIDEIEGYIAGGCKASSTQIVSTAKPTPKKTPSKKAENQSTTDDDSEFDALFAESNSTTKTPVSNSKKRQKSADSDEMTKSNKKAKKPPKKEEPEEDEDLDLTPSNHVNNRKSASSAVSSFLDRPYLNRPPPSSPTLVDMSSTSKVLAEKDIQPSTLKFGFLGLGIMGTGCVKNLLNSGHSVTVWNRTNDKCKDFAKAGAKEAITPGDV